MTKREMVARALARCHYRRRFGRPADNDLVTQNVEINWQSFLDTADTAIAVCEAYDHAS